MGDKTTITAYRKAMGETGFVVVARDPPDYAINAGVARDMLCSDNGCSDRVRHVWNEIIGVLDRGEDGPVPPRAVNAPEAQTEEDALRRFVRESNWIEGIRREPSLKEIAITREFLNLDFIAVRHVVDLVKVYQPAAMLRSEPGLDVLDIVRFGSHVAPPGGPEIAEALADILRKAQRPNASFYITHHNYERLHPFNDGNGRSGRALWLWQFWRQHGFVPESFLRQFYYQALEA
jgi:hypothetical protein|tara:strand:- start:360 stop:1061 length:702 start_codon:yes stop_codon:yes gene_type:complete